MTSIKFSHISIFLVTLEVAVAVVILIPLSVLFGFFALLSYEHKDAEDSFYPDEIKPLLTAALVIFASIYAIQFFQLFSGILMLYSFNLMEINLIGTVRTCWFCLVTSLTTCSILVYLLIKTVTEYNCNSIFITTLVTFLLQKLITFGFLLGFNVSACLVVL